MGIKCVKPNYCCGQIDLSRKSKSSQDTLNPNELADNNNTNRKKSIFGVNSFANKFLKLESKMSRASLKSNNSQLTIINNNLKFISEISQLTIMNEVNKKEEDIKMIKKIFSKNYFLKTLNEKNKEDIMKEIRLAKIGGNKLVIKEGYEGRLLYIIRKGLVELIKDNIIIKTYSKGESFGEIALLHKYFRTSTIRTISECEFWILERISFRKIIDASTIENYKENKKFINSINIFRALENYQISLLCSALYKEMYIKDNIIAKEGDIANCIYIIKEGEVNCVKEGRIIRTLSKGENFGERSIFLDTKRSLDVIAKTNCICYLISFDILKTVLGFSYRNVLLHQIIKMAFSKSIYFKDIHLQFIERILHLFIMKNYNKEEIAYKKGDDLSEIVSVIIDGSLINKNKEIIGNRGEILFEQNVFNQGNNILEYDLIVDPDCLICEADMKEIFKSLRVDNFFVLRNKSIEMNILSQSELLRKFNFEKIEFLLSKMGRKKYKENEIIISKGKEGKNIFFIKEGKVRIENLNQDISINSMGTFGYKELGISSSIGENLLFTNYYNDTIIASSDCELLYINKSSFENTLGENLLSYLKNWLLLRDKNLNLRDFDFYGDFNVHFNPIVSLIKSRTNNRFYVIKSYPKDLIIKEDSFNHISELKKINLKIDYPFISNYIKTLQDKNYIYFLFEYIEGIQLSEIIKNNENNYIQFTKRQLQFYFSNLLLIINYLHSKSIIHRSIQPDNLIINKNGYLKLITLTTSKIIEDRTNTIVGNIFYMSPEVILGEGYSFEADYWSSAVLMYEICFGKKPFEGNVDDPMTVYFSIINGNLNFPNNYYDLSLISLLSNMLEKSPFNRYSKIELIQSHSWFNNFDFKDVEFLKINPEFIPNIKDIKYENNESFLKHSILMYQEWKNEFQVFVEESKRKEYECWFEGF